MLYQIQPKEEQEQIHVKKPQDQNYMKGRTERREQRLHIFICLHCDVWYLVGVLRLWGQM